MRRSTSFLDDELDQDGTGTGDFVDSSPVQRATASYSPVAPEADEEQALTPEFSRIESPPPEASVFGTPVAGSAKTPTQTPGQIAAARAAELAGQRPERPKPGFWRTLGSIGAGLGAGYANATGKNMPQVDVGAVMDNIKYGGYNRKVGDWANTTADAERKAKDLMLAEKEAKDNATQVSTANLQDSQATYYKAHALQLAKEKNVRYIKLPGSAGIYDTQTETIINGPGKTLVPVGAGGLYDIETKEVIGAPDKPPKPHTTNDYLTIVSPIDKKPHKYLPDPDDPGNPAKMQDMGLAVEPNDPLAAIAARADAADALDTKRAGRATQTQLSAATTGENVAYRQAEDKAATARRALDEEFSGAIDPKKGGRKHPDKSDPRYASGLAAIADQLMKDKQSARNASENTYAQHGVTPQHIEYPNPMTQMTAPPPPPGGGPSAPPPSAAGPVDPRVKAYADKFFGGDIAKAKTAIAAQQAGRK